MDDAAGGRTPPRPNPLPQGARGRRPPRWTVAFLRALERTGKARWAAEDAGVDFTTAYARRKAHPDFAAEWAAALERFRAARDEVRGAELAETVERLRKGPSPSPSHGSAAGPSLSFEGRGADGREHLIVNGQLRRVGPGRWSKRKEEALLAELAWSGNIRRGCKAAGMSEQALSKRRLKDRHLDAACDAAVEIARARLNGYVVEAANRAFDPDDLPLGDGDAKRTPVTVAEAIQILKLGGGARAARAAEPEPRSDIEDVRAKIEATMRKLGLIRDDEAGDEPRCGRCRGPLGGGKSGGGEGAEGDFTPRS